MLSRIAFILILFSLLCSYIDTLIEFGRCPYRPSKLTTVDLNRLSGNWYVVATSDKTDSLFRCTTMDFKTSGNSEFSVTINSKRLDGRTIISEGKARQKDNPVEFNISFSDNYFSDLFKDDFEVIDTDYDKYAIIYTCGDFTTFRYENIWILLRSLDNYREEISNYTYFIDERFDIEREDLFIIDHGVEYCDYSNVNYTMSDSNSTYPEASD